MDELKLANRILKNERYLKIVEHIKELESDRIFCRHDIEHFLDVARIAAMMDNDHNTGISRDLIYSAALLHDIGRAKQYETGIAHEAAGIPIAEEILHECGAKESDIGLITDAIREHGNEAVKNENNLRGLLYRADKASRKCFSCDAAGSCHKAPPKRVMEIMY